MKVVLGLFGLLILIAVIGKFSQDYLKNGSVPFFTSTKDAVINGHTFKLEEAKTAKDKEVGLSNKSSLPQDGGMLFKFDKPDFYAFWMKNMKFPIDIIYVGGGHVVSVFPNQQPPKSDEVPAIVRPEEKADAVIEIAAGEAEKYHIKKGDTVTIK